MRDKQTDLDMWRRDVDQKMVRLMNLRETMPQEVNATKEEKTNICQNVIQI